MRSPNISVQAQSDADIEAAAQLTWLGDVERRPRRVAIGNFDGVHLGHATVIEGCDTVLTFAPHPLAVLVPDRAPAVLTDATAKAELIGALGVGEVVLIPFDRTVAAGSAQAFIDEVLIGRLGATHISVGEHFRFGAGARGDVALLAHDRRVTTSVTRLRSAGGEVISSSRIRAAIAAGRVGLAWALLGRPHRLACTVLATQRRRALPAGWIIAHVRIDGRSACPERGSYEVRSHGSGAQIAPSTTLTLGRRDRGGDRQAIVTLPTAQLAAGKLSLELLNRHAPAPSTTRRGIPLSVVP